MIDNYDLWLVHLYAHHKGATLVPHKGCPHCAPFIAAARLLGTPVDPL